MHACRLVLTVAAVLLVPATAAHADTLTVTTTANTGEGSLRDRVAGADSGDTVFVPASALPYTVSGSINSTGKDLTIQGAGAATTVIDGGAASRLFFVSGDVTFEDMTLRGGNSGGAAPGGGALVADSGDLVLRRVAFTGNSASPGGTGNVGGGALYARNAGTVTIEASTFSGNSLGGAIVGPRGGGAVYSQKPGGLTIESTTFTGNTVTQGNGFDNGGGAIANIAGPLTVRSSTIDDNSFTSAGTNGDSGGGGIFSLGSRLTISDSSVSGNATSPGNQGGGDYGGGAVMHAGPGSAATDEVVIERSDLSRNSVTVSGEQPGDSSGGGALHVWGTDVDVTIRGSDLNDNTVVAEGTDATPSNGDPTPLVGSGGGGVLYNGGATLFVDHASVSRNTATVRHVVPARLNSDSGGGGILATGVARTEIESSTIADNTFTVAGNGTRRGGGGVFVPAFAGLFIEQVTIAGNRALGAGATDDSRAAGGNVRAEGPTHHFGSINAYGDATAPGTSNCTGAGPLQTDRKNVEDRNECGFGPNDKTGVDPLLGPLGDHGGGTLTRMLLAGSPALGAGVFPHLSSPTDQRGVPRPANAVTDAGAVQVEPPGVDTGAATDIGQTSASLAAVVDPNFNATTARIELGTTTNYGTTVALPDPGDGGDPRNVAARVEGLEPGTEYHYRAVATGPRGTVAGPDRTFTTAARPPGADGGGTGGGAEPDELDQLAPGIDRFALTRRRFRVGRTPTPTAAGGRGVPAGTVFRYALSEAATVRIRIERLRPGRRLGRRCVKPTRANRKRRRCVRVQLVGTLTRRSPAGPSSVPFSGRIGRRALRPGSYRATITAADAAGNSAVPKTAKFTVVR